jgi:hypothetical protein
MRRVRLSPTHGPLEWTGRGGSNGLRAHFTRATISTWRLPHCEHRTDFKGGRPAHLFTGAHRRGGSRADHCRIS